jgi:hypothetical protein
MSSTTEATALRRDRSDRGAPPRTRFDKFPRGPVARWMLRLALAAPYAMLAVLLALLPAPVGTPNADLVESLGGIDWTRGDAEWLALLYPHVSIMLAAANPFGRIGLSLMGAIAAGFLLQKVAEIIAQRAIPRSTGIILVFAFAANPLFAYFALENLPGFLALTFFGLALGDIVRFVNWGNTESGFRGGILIMLAAFSDPSGILYAMIIVLASPFLRHGRPAAPGLRAANMLVIAFPTLGAFVTIAFLNLLFFGALWPTSDVAAIVDGIVPGVGALVALYSTPTGWLIAAPLASAWLVAIIVRRPKSIIVSSIVFLLLNVAFLLGAFHPGAAGASFALLTLLAIALIPAARTVTTNVLVDLVAVIQIAIAWLAAIDDPIVLAWTQSIADAATALLR